MVWGLGLGPTCGSKKPTVLRVRPSNLRVITYYFVGFGDTGIGSESSELRAFRV